MIKVRFFSLFESVPTNEHLKIDDVQGDVGSLIKRLVKAYPGLKEEILTFEGKLEYYILISVNNQAITALKGLKTKLRDGDQVDFYLVLAGG